MHHSFKQKLLAYGLLAAFLLPLAATEWHGYVLQVSHECAQHSEQHSDKTLLADGELHNTHHCALCDLQLSSILIPDFSPPTLACAIAPAALIGALPPFAPAASRPTLSNRGPPSA